MKIAFLCLLAAGISLLTAVFLRNFVLRKNFLDIPNQRSSHTRPTPSGGGLAFALSFLLLSPFLVGTAVVPTVLFGLLGAGGLIMMIGFIDDYKFVPVRWRLFVHCIAASWGLACLGGLPPIIFNTSPVNPGIIMNGCAVIYLVWLLNLYNFMDGIDGIASIETITACLGVVILASLVDAPAVIWMFPVLLASTVAGFLFLNFPPATLFMGDSGSGFLGITLGIFSLQAAWSLPRFFWVWLILLGVFMVDATCTLLDRLRCGENISHAHCSHAFQVAARKFSSHRFVSVGVACINLFWLFPVAVAVTFQKINGVSGIVLAYIPLGILWYWFRYRSDAKCNGIEEIRG